MKTGEKKGKGNGEKGKDSTMLQREDRRRPWRWIKGIIKKKKNNGNNCTGLVEKIQEKKNQSKTIINC